MNKIIYKIEKMILGCDEPNEHHLSIHCNCLECASITDLQGR